MFFHFMLEVELGVTNIASEISLFFVNCLHVLFEIALAYKTSSTNLTDFHVLEKKKSSNNNIHFWLSGVRRGFMPPQLKTC